MDDTRKRRRYNNSADIAENHDASDDDKMNSRGAQQESDVDGTIVVDFRCPKIEIFHPDIDEEQPHQEESAIQELDVEEPTAIPPSSLTSGRAQAREGVAGDTTNGPSRSELQQWLVAMANENRLLKQQAKEKTNQNHLMSQRAEEARKENRLLRQQAKETKNQKHLMRQRAETTTDENRILRQQAKDTSNENRMLRQKVKNPKGRSLKAEIIIAIMAAVFGYNAPIIFDVDEVIDDNNGLIAGIHSSSHPRASFYILLAAVNFSDAFLDLMVSIRELLQDDDVSINDDAVLRGWAMVLFSMTVAARVLAGVFGVVYHRIDKADRQLSYFQVEMTIFAMEDFASIIFMYLKYRHVGICDPAEWNPLDLASMILTVMCLFFLILPTLCQSKNNKILVVLYVWITTSVLLLVGLFITVYTLNFENLDMEVILRGLYPFILVEQMCLLSWWSLHLYRKTTKQPSDETIAEPNLTDILRSKQIEVLFGRRYNNFELAGL